MLGGDTPTAPLGVSMRDALTLAAADDERIELREQLDRRALAAVIREHDVVIAPSLWECWPYAALEALHLNRPVLGTPVGGLAEMIKPGVSGWLTAGTGSDALEQGLEQLLERRAELESIVRRGAPSMHAAQLCDEGEILDGYEGLARCRPRRRRRCGGGWVAVGVGGGAVFPFVGVCG